MYAWVSISPKGDLNAKRNIYERFCLLFCCFERKMKAFGMIFVFAAAYLFSQETIRKKRGRIMVLDELVRFTEHLKIKIGCYLTPIQSAAADFSSDTLERLGFLSDFSSMGADGAYASLEGRIDISEEAKRVFRAFFSKIGRGYVEDEKRLIETTLDELGPILLREREAGARDAKLSAILSCSGAIALVILLV